MVPGQGKTGHRGSSRGATRSERDGKGQRAYFGNGTPKRTCSHIRGPRPRPPEHPFSSPARRQVWLSACRAPIVIKTLDAPCALVTAGSPVPRPGRIHQRSLTPSCGGHAPTAERIVGPARMIVESLTPRPGIREHNRSSTSLQALVTHFRLSPDSRHIAASHRSTTNRLNAAGRGG